MPKNRELTAEERCQIITMSKLNMKGVDIARQMNLGESTIRAVINRWEIQRSIIQPTEVAVLRNSEREKLGD